MAIDSLWEDHLRELESHREVFRRERGEMLDEMFKGYPELRAVAEEFVRYQDEEQERMIMFGDPEIPANRPVGILNMRPRMSEQAKIALDVTLCGNAVADFSRRRVKHVPWHEFSQETCGLSAIRPTAKVRRERRKRAMAEG